MGETKKRIAENLKKYRDLAGLQQKEVAEMLGIKSNTLSNWENEKNSIDIETLWILCKIYKVTLDDMYGIKKEPAPETDSLEWLRQGLIDSHLIKHRTELTEEQFKLLFGTIEAITKGFKQDIIK